MSNRCAAISSRLLLAGLLLSVIIALSLRLTVLRQESHLIEVKRTIPVLGTYATFIVIAPEESSGTIFRSMDSLARQLDQELGVFGTGELSRLNLTGVAVVSDMSADLSHLLQRSLFIASITDSLFDPLMGNLVSAWGFPDSPCVPDSGEIADAMASSGLGNLRISSDSIHLLHGAQLDFGAIAKGFAADRIFNHALACGASAVLVEIGGEIRCGGDEQTGRVWKLAIRDPRQDSFSEVIDMKNGSLATSGDYESFFEEDGMRFCHIIDPRTGYPQVGIASVTVIGEDCETADALATAISVGGIETASAIPDSLFRAILVILEDEEGTTSQWRRGEW